MVTVGGIFAAVLLGCVCGLRLFAGGAALFYRLGAGAPGLFWGGGSQESLADFFKVGAAVGVVRVSAITGGGLVPPPPGFLCGFRRFLRAFHGWPIKE